jgi:hypothetical protein
MNFWCVSLLEILNNTSLLDQNSKIISISVLNSLLYVDTIQTIHQVLIHLLLSLYLQSSLGINLALIIQIQEIID